MAPNFSMKDWKTGQPVSFMQALGFSGTTLKFPTLTAQLPQQSEDQSHKGQGGKSPKPPATGGPVRQYARKLLTSYGWANQFTSLNDIIMAESGWNPHIKNPSSGAYGIAQAYGHGQGAATQGTESNMYGGYGLTDKQAKAANSGNAYWQLVWMMNYIKATYGTPNGAWSFHQANGAY